MARLANGTVTFYNLDGDEIEKKPTQIKWDAEAAEKAGYEHFMLKEIHEQPKAVQDTLNSVLKLTSHEERLSTSLITPILLPSGECLAVVVYIR